MLSLLMDDLTQFFNTFVSPTWRWVTWTFQILNQSLASFDMWIQRFVFYSMHHHEGLFKAFHMW